MDDLKRVASEAVGWFETAERTNGTKFVRTRDGAPDWLNNLVRDAHDGMMPDNWRYEAISRALAAAQYGELADEGGCVNEWADGHVDIYTTDLTRWLASHLDRVGYVDEAVELGMSPERASIDGLLRLGQYCELEEVAVLVLESLKARSENDSRRPMGVIEND